MTVQARIPHGDEKVTIELTVKELMALSGIRFHNNHHIEISARKKLNQVIESTCRDIQAEGPIDYQLLV
ncbi:hypothetical protein [Paenibacillus glycanilyticus]|uniref:Uncharacterized protein n=1 Tax=Paenibacillus glycanilyticus TaxID=126569 RepID=A0ABQ6G9K2_9BACL|nr:hypothetical protein [Paenibacillus glycanilyticus]GLX67639.1 hypothetical protein MU1_19840 [Paenibacillus glycanilyticus]